MKSGNTYKNVNAYFSLMEGLRELYDKEGSSDAAVKGGSQSGMTLLAPPSSEDLVMTPDTSARTSSRSDTVLYTIVHLTFPRTLGGTISSSILQVRKQTIRRQVILLKVIQLVSDRARI